MRPIHIAMIALVLTLPATGAAQTAAVTPAGADTSSSDTTSPAPKKKGGLFGKVKGIAKNKVVKAVAKTAACTMLPGGHLIAGAIDGGVSKDAIGAAASSVSGQTSCMPGGLGAKGIAGTAAQAAAAEAQAGPPIPGMPLVEAYAGAAERAPDPDKIARCLGLTPTEYRALTDPTRGVSRQATDEEMNRYAEIRKKLDMSSYQRCMMPQ